MTLLYFIIAISILVVIHEYGHFWVARRCGVHVLRFSVGFGKPLWSIRDKRGTEYSIAPIPLGGYVKMLDEREAPVPEHLLDQAFNRKPAWQRIAIASAGPIANFLFAIAAYWVLFVAGTTGVVPVVGDVSENSPAALAGLKSGDEILAVNGDATTSWEQVSWELISYIGEDATITLTVRGDTLVEHSVNIEVTEWLAGADVPDPISGLGIEPRRLTIPAKLGQIVDGSPAQAAGLQVGDLVVAVNGEPMADWSQWVDAVRVAPNQPLQIEIRRDDQLLDLILTPERATLADGAVVGRVGAGVEMPSIPDDWLRVSHAGIIDGFALGVSKTSDLIGFTLESLWKMLAGDLSVKNLSGPITIAKVAGASASSGLESFVGFLALLSVSLGVLNLLPVPMLDGGHILFYLAEMLRGKPLPERLQIAAVQVGMFLMLSLMLVAFYNDISRL